MFQLNINNVYQMLLTVSLIVVGFGVTKFIDTSNDMDDKLTVLTPQLHSVTVHGHRDSVILNQIKYKLDSAKALSKNEVSYYDSLLTSHEQLNFENGIRNKRLSSQLRSDAKMYNLSSWTYFAVSMIGLVSFWIFYTALKKSELVDRSLTLTKAYKKGRI